MTKSTGRRARAKKSPFVKGNRYKIWLLQEQGEQQNPEQNTVENVNLDHAEYGQENGKECC